MDKKMVTIFLVLFMLPMLTLAQEVKLDKKAPAVVGPESSEINLPLGTDKPNTAANYIAVDTMSNSFGPSSPTLNPVAVDPYSNIAAVVYRGKTPYAQGSGELWWSTTQDNGASWQRSLTSVQNNLTSQIFARYPSMTIWNPTASSSMEDLLGAYAWAELGAGGAGFENIGYGVATGLQVSDYAAIIPPTTSPYSSNAPIWADDEYVYWVADFGPGAPADLTFFRTADFIDVDVSIPSTWVSARFNDGGNIALGGVAHNGVIYYGVSGTFTEEIGDGGWEVGYSKSTDNGDTWSDWFVVDWTQIPATANYIRLWDWKKGDAFVSYAGDIQVDKDGFVHILCGLTDTTGSMGGEIGYNAIVEFFETAEGVWDAKILAEGDDVHDNSIYEGPLVGGYNQDPGIGQCGPMFMLATNMDRDFLVAQWDIGSPEAGDTLCDIYMATRDLTERAEWSVPMNLTETDQMNEDGSHLAPYLATVNVGDTMLVDYAYSMFWYEAGNTGPYIDPLNPTVVYLAAVPVRETPILSAGNDFTVFDFKLEQNYPNPFNPSTSIKYSLAEASEVNLRVYDVLGNEVATLVNSAQNAGAYNVTFDASNLASGLYIYTLKTGNFVSSKKMMLLK
jgi:hypothetical protein